MSLLEPLFKLATKSSHPQFTCETFEEARKARSYSFLRIFGSRRGDAN